MSLEARVRITNPTGLHARPAVKLAQLAAGFDADVDVRVGENGHWVRARSTAKVMKLKAGTNATLHFRAAGLEASDALTALIDFVRRDFDEGPGMRCAEGGALPTPARGYALAPSETGADHVIGGEVASRGVALGRLHVRVEDGLVPRAACSPELERRAFEDAVEKAAGQLEALSAGVDAAEVVAFQVGLLRDEEFMEPVREAIARGIPADQAWDLHLSREIADYQSAEDGYFRDRAADLRDLHERVERALCGSSGDGAAVPEGAIVVTDELTPSRFLELDWHRLAGAATREGSAASHVAMLARSRGVPLIVRLDRDPTELEEDAEAIIDAERGYLLLAPSPATRRRYERHLAARRAQAREEASSLDKPALTANGTPITVYLNVDDPALLKAVDPAHCDGIGLTRTEFLFQGRAALPDEDLQYAVYRRLVDWGGGRPVTIRTLDAGGDKPIPGLTLDGERNPFLGERGLRLLLARPDVFRPQLRALARAAAHGPLKVLLPMVTLPAELEEARRMFEEEVVRLGGAGIAACRPPLGIMVEVPAAALTIEQFAADFFSIGSNDLTQYVMAAGRDSPRTAALQDPLHPAVMTLVRRVAEHGRASGVEVSVCGEMAATPACLPALLEAGVRVISVPPAMLATVKAAIAAL
jgi:phosphotransferase system enzyme I (PtsI)